jgi:hypothetical protein
VVQDIKSRVQGLCSGFPASSSSFRFAIMFQDPGARFVF